MKSFGWALVAPIAFVANTVFHLWREHAIAGGAGFPIDDAWIHLALARNLAAGDGFAINPGDWVGASAAPLWTLLLAPIVGGLGPSVFAIRLLGFGLTLLALETTRRAARAACPDRPGVAALAATLLALLPTTAFGALSGLEVPLAVWLVSLVLLAEAKLGSAPGLRGVLPSLFVGFAALARPEALAFAPWVWFSAGLRPRVIGARIAATALPLLPVAIVHWASHGGPLPTTFYAKIHRSRNPMGGQGLLFALENASASGVFRVVCRTSFAQLTMFFDEIMRASPLLLPALGAGLIAREARRVVWFAGFAVVVVPLAIGVMSPRPDFGAGGRYAAFLMPAVALLAALGVGRVWRGLDRRVGLAVCVLLALPLGLALDRGARYHAMAVKNTREMHETLAKWVAESIPESATIAVHDIGALAFFGRSRLFDLEGIASPELLGRKRDPALLFASLFERRPDYLIVAPNWYPDLVRRDDMFRPIHVVEIPPQENHVLAGPTMVVFKATWPPKR